MYYLIQYPRKIIYETFYKYSQVPGNKNISNYGIMTTDTQYTDYFNKIENSLYQEAWRGQRIDRLLSIFEQCIQYLLASQL